MAGHIKVDKNKEGSGRRTTDRNKMRERKKKRNMKVRKEKRKGQRGRARAGGGSRQNEIFGGRHEKRQLGRTKWRQEEKVVRLKINKRRGKVREQ